MKRECRGREEENKRKERKGAVVEYYRIASENLVTED